MSPATATIMEHAFARAGVKKADAVFSAAISLFFNSGGTVEEAHKLIDKAAAQLPGGGHVKPDQQVHLRRAAPRQPHDVQQMAKETVSASDQFISATAVRQPARAQEEASLPVPIGQCVHASPAREPSAGRLRAAAQQSKLNAKSILDLTKTHDGRAWGDVFPYELASMRRDGEMAKAFADYLGPLNQRQQEAPLRNLIRPDQAELIIERVRGRNDAS